MTVRTQISIFAAVIAVLAFSAAPALAAAPEAPVTEAPSPIAGTTATFNGELIPGTSTEKVTYHFAYSAGSAAACTESGVTAPGEPFPEAEDNEKVAEPVTGLEGSTEYTVCLIAANPAQPAESTQGSPVKFKTLASKPVIVSETPTAITPFDASLEAVLNPERRVTTYHFEYALTKLAVEKSEGTSFGESSTPAASESQGTGPIDIGGGLTPSTTYFFRIVTSSANGATNGPVESFETTPLEAPVIDSESVTGVTQTNAELHALINPNYQETSFQFRLGESPAYGLGPLPALPAGLGGAGFSGELPAAVNLQTPEEVKLEPNTEYHYEALATNGTGTTEGHTALGDQTFLTLPNPPSASTGKVLSLAASSATVAGLVDPGSGGHHAQDDTTYYFEYGHATTYGLRVPNPVGDAGEGAGAREVQAILNGLEPGRSYHYRIVASNDNANTEGGLPQVVYGEDETFTTPATPPILSGVSVSGVTQSGATITATLDPQDLPTRYELQLGATPGLLQPAAAGTTSTTIPLSLAVGSLSPGTTYYYKLVAVNMNDTVEPESAKGSFTTALAPAGVAPGALPALIPFQSIAELNAKEAKEDKGLPGPTVTKSLTRAQRLSKALKVCRKDRSKAKRTKCEASARKKYPPSKQKKAKQ
jgi:hypothetical protein